MVKHLLLLVLVAGCKLTETLETTLGDPVVQVEAVIDPTRDRQFGVRVQRSQPGSDTLTTGIAGAVVTLTDLDPRGCSQPTVLLHDGGAGLYVFLDDWCRLGAGDRVSLRVVTPDGVVVTGMTRIPGIRSVQVRAGATSTQVPLGRLSMDRTRDSIHINADLTETHALQIEALRGSTNESATLRFVSDTLSLDVAGDLVDPFDERTVFRAGCYYELTVAAVDTNYWDFTRSIANPLTGQGFINHLTGGIGVFGSVVPVTYELRVTAPQIDPREGVYRLTGQVRRDSVDVTWDVYRDALSATRIRAFVDGHWGSQSVRTSANGSFTGEVFRGTIFYSVGEGPVAPTPQAFDPGPAFTFIGTRAAPGTPFPVEVRIAGLNPPPADTVMAVQVSGPKGP